MVIRLNQGLVADLGISDAIRDVKFAALQRHGEFGLYSVNKIDRSLAAGRVAGLSKDLILLVGEVFLLLVLH